MSIVNPDSFLSKYGLTLGDLDQTGLDWDTIHGITAEYNQILPTLDAIGRGIVDSLLTCTHVHSINYRLKEEEHLIEKIIRKKKAFPECNFTPENYRNHIFDLIGVRALHLFKEDWLEIHSFILNAWQLDSAPIAYIRSGDSENIIQYYREKECEVREHQFGYRSVHYHLYTVSGEQIFTSEIQTRTIFEEAWGEIDHVMRYPYDQDNELMLRLSLILNQLAANADELAGYMRYLKHKTKSMEQRYTGVISEKDSIISNLKKKISTLEIAGDSKRDLALDLDALANNRQSEFELLGDYPWLEHFMESNLFQDISKDIKRLSLSNNFKDLQLNPTEVDILTKAQQDLLRLIKNSNLA